MIRALTLIIALAFCGCEHFHAKTFFTTNPLYYTDLFPGNQEDWEQFTWAEAQREVARKYPHELFEGATAICGKRPQDMIAPKVKALHAFNFGGAQAMYNKSNDVILYPIGNIEALFHEYSHAMDTQWSPECLSEMLAIERSRDWKPKFKSAR